MAEVQLINAEQLCTLTGLTDRRHRQLAEDGWFPAPVKAQYRFIATIQGILRYYREDHQRHGNQFAEEKLAKIKAERELLDLEILRKRGELIALAEVQQRVSKWIVQFKQVVMNTKMSEVEKNACLHSIAEICYADVPKPKPAKAKAT